MIAFPDPGGSPTSTSRSPSEVTTRFGLRSHWHVPGQTVGRSANWLRLPGSPKHSLRTSYALWFAPAWWTPVPAAAVGILCPGIPTSCPCSRWWRPQRVPCGLTGARCVEGHVIGTKCVHCTPPGRKRSVPYATCCRRRHLEMCLSATSSWSRASLMFPLIAIDSRGRHDRYQVS